LLEALVDTLAAPAAAAAAAAAADGARQAAAAEPTADSCYLFAWLVATSMRHWGLLDIVDTAASSAPPPTRCPAPAPPPPTSLPDMAQEWGPNLEPYFFYQRLVGVCAGMAATLDPAAPHALCLLSNLLVLHSMLEQQAAAAAHQDASCRRKAQPAAAAALSRKGRRGQKAGQDETGSGGRAQLLTYVQVELRLQACVLLRRLVRYECGRMEQAGQRVALACCAAQLPRTGRDLGSEVQAAAEEALELLARRLARHSLLACVRRCVAQAVMAALDAVLLDSMLRHGLASSFDGALQLKDAAARLERLALKLAPQLGLPPPLAAPDQLALPLTRQVPHPSSSCASDWVRGVCPSRMPQAAASSNCRQAGVRGACQER